MGDVGAAEFLRRFHQVLGNEGAGNSRYQRVLLHVHAVCLDGGNAVFLRKLILGIDNDGLYGTAVKCTLANRFHIFAALAQVQGNGDYVTTGHFCQVWDGNGSIKATRVSQDYACGHG